MDFDSYKLQCEQGRKIMSKKLTREHPVKVFTAFTTVHSVHVVSRPSYISTESNNSFVPKR